MRLRVPKPQREVLTVGLSPDMSLLDPTSYIAPYNSFAMSSAEFVPHILKVMEELGVSLRERTNFIT